MNQIVPEGSGKNSGTNPVETFHSSGVGSTGRPKVLLKENDDSLPTSEVRNTGPSSRREGRSGTLFYAERDFQGETEVPRGSGTDPLKVRPGSAVRVRTDLGRNGDQIKELRRDKNV